MFTRDELGSQMKDELLMQGLERKLAAERQHVEELENLIQDLRAARFLREDLDATAASSSPLPHVSIQGPPVLFVCLPAPHQQCQIMQRAQWNAHHI